MAPVEVIEARQDPPMGMIVAAEQGDVRLGDVAQPPGNLVHLREAAVYGLVQHLAGLGELDGAMATNEKRNPERLFELAHRAADCGLRQFQLVCGQCERHIPGRNLEDEQMLPRDGDFPQFLHLACRIAKTCLDFVRYQAGRQ